MRRYKAALLACIMMTTIFIGSLVFFRNTTAFSPKKIEGIEDVAQSFEDFKIPTDVKVVGIGEITHGNREFQTVKKDVLEKVVKDGDGRCICFEMTVGEGAMFNDAIHDKDADLVKLVGKQSYPLYDTEEIVALLEWMREYNEGLPYEESLMFYGVDMQGSIFTLDYLQNLCREGCNLITEEEKETILSIDKENRDQIVSNRDFFLKMSERLSAIDDLRCEQLAMVPKDIVLGIDSPDYDRDQSGYQDYRDLKMAENLMDYSEIEGKRGYSQVVITAHSGHERIGRDSEITGKDWKNMGYHINRLTEGSYFCIGTDYYEGYVNIHTAGTYDDEYERADHYFCSEDPLAYQAKYFENGTYCLDFSKVTDENSIVYKDVHGAIFTGGVGEGYAPSWELASGKGKTVPAEEYDAMIYFYEVTPIHTIHY
ncbi:MAG: erythromycin esterase family protein [Butyrivibrio sp.]|nr:erythromycin esterase family protein [Butyrivibrio sp.]